MAIVEGQCPASLGPCKKGRRYTSYVCTRAVRARDACAYYNGHASKKLESAVLDYLGQFSDPKRVSELLSESSRSDSVRNNRELNRLEKKLIGLDTDFQKNLEYLKSGLLNEEEFGVANVQRRDDRARTEIRLSELRETLEKAEAARESTSVLPGQVDTFLKSFEFLDVPKAKAILQTILESAHIWRDGKIELKFRS